MSIGTLFSGLKVSIGVQDKGTQTVVETPTFIAAAHKLFNSEEIARVVDTVAGDPQCGEVMEGTGGFGKFRFARKGKGKSGGVRVVYIYKNEQFPIFLITVFAKNEKANLSRAERNELRKKANSIFTNYRR